MGGWQAVGVQLAGTTPRIQSRLEVLYVHMLTVVLLQLPTGVTASTKSTRRHMKKQRRLRFMPMPMQKCVHGEACRHIYAMHMCMHRWW